MSPYDILTNLIEKLILPNYPDLKLDSVDSMILGNRRSYDVRIRTPKRLEPEIQMKIDTDIKNLFKMASLDQQERNNFSKNNIVTWFKTPNAKDWSFHGKFDYEHY